MGYCVPCKSRVNANALTINDANNSTGGKIWKFLGFPHALNLEFSHKKKLNPLMVDHPLTIHRYHLQRLLNEKKNTLENKTKGFFFSMKLTWQFLLHHLCFYWRDTQKLLLEHCSPIDISKLTQKIDHFHYHKNSISWVFFFPSSSRADFTNHSPTIRSN